MQLPEKRLPQWLVVSTGRALFGSREWRILALRYGQTGECQKEYPCVEPSHACLLLCQWGNIVFARIHLWAACGSLLQCISGSWGGGVDSTWTKNARRSLSV